MKVLAIEDQPVAAMQLMALLRSLGHEAELVKNAADAWARLTNGAYRVVVSDWRMPGIDGLGLCRMIRERGGDYVYFILISSSQITPANRKLALEAGVDDFLSKPLNGEELSMRLHVAGRIISLTSQVQQLKSFLPICGYCKKIRDDNKYWHEVETYFSDNQGTTFSQSTCPDCAKAPLIPALPPT
jgi:sigma-B regulation protein RsbU (phosphoserine phosphatase)